MKFDKSNQTCMMSRLNELNESLKEFKEKMMQDHETFSAKLTYLVKSFDKFKTNVIRGGTIGQGGMTDFLTVLETYDVRALYNRDGGKKWQIIPM